MQRLPQRATASVEIGRASGAAVGARSMTGEDMIIKTVAKLLHEARDDKYAHLRLVFWIAGRCEHCGAPHVCDGKMLCRSCGNAIVNRVSPEKTQPEKKPVEDLGDPTSFCGFQGCMGGYGHSGPHS